MNRRSSRRLNPRRKMMLMSYPEEIVNSKRDKSSRKKHRTRKKYRTRKKHRARKKTRSKSRRKQRAIKKTRSKSRGKMQPPPSILTEPEPEPEPEPESEYNPRRLGLPGGPLTVDDFNIESIKKKSGVDPRLMNALGLKLSDLPIDEEPAGGRKAAEAPGRMETSDTETEYCVICMQPFINHTNQLLRFYKCKHLICLSCHNSLLVGRESVRADLRRQGYSPQVVDEKGKDNCPSCRNDNPLSGIEFLDANNYFGNIICNEEDEGTLKKVAKSHINPEGVQLLVTMRHYTWDFSSTKHIIKLIKDGTIRKAKRLGI